MKNNFNISWFFILISLLVLYSTKLSGADLVVDAEVVDIKENGNLIVGKGSVNIVDGNNLSSKGENVRYNRLSQVVEIDGNVILFDTEKNSKVTSNKIIFDRNQNTISSFGKTNVNIFDNSNKNIEFNVSGENATINRNTKILI